jgi:hypothetical protein
LFVKGTSEGADELRNSLRAAARMLIQECDVFAKKLNELESSCRDESYCEMQQATLQAIKYVKQMVPELLVVCDHLKAYGDFLRGDSEPGGGHVDSHGQNGATSGRQAKPAEVSGALLSKVPASRKQAIERAFRHAPGGVVAALNQFANVLEPVEDSGYGQNEEGAWVKSGSYYSPSENRVRMNEAMDDDEYQEVLPHELSHFLDHQRGWDSGKPAFIEALERDLKSMDRTTPEGRMRFHEMLDDAISTGAADNRAISDLLFGAFGENGNDPEIMARFDKEAIICYSHSDNYWMGISDDGTRAMDGGASMRRAEIYAEIGAVRCLNDRKSNNFLERYFPGIYHQYNLFYGIEGREVK